MKYNIPPQEKTISDLWRIAQKKNCDDFVNLFKSTNMKVVYYEDDKELLEYQEIQKKALQLRDSFREETDINYVHTNRMPYVAYIEWLEHKLLTQK